MPAAFYRFFRPVVMPIAFRQVDLAGIAFCRQRRYDQIIAEDVLIVNTLGLLIARIIGNHCSDGRLAGGMVLFKGFHQLGDQALTHL